MFEETFYGVSYLIIGFAVGMVLEYFAIKFYTLIDKKAKSDLLLYITLLIQIFILIFLMENVQILNHTYGKIGLLASQFFLFEYAVKRIPKPLTLQQFG